MLLVPNLVAESQRFGHLAAYPQAVVQNAYRLIRIAMPFLPVGMLLALALPHTMVRLTVLLSVVGGISLAFVLVMDATSMALLRDMLFVVPGVAAGMWLAERSRLQIPLTRGDSVTAAQHSDSRQHILSKVFVRAAAGEGGATDQLGQGSANSSHLLTRWTGRLVGAVCVAAAIALALGLPRWGVAVSLGLCLYAGFMWWRPLMGLAVVPAALALLDLAPWTGRFFLDEFDLLMLTTLALGLWHGRLAMGVGRDGRLNALLLVFVLITAISLLLGMFPLQAWDANALSAYWSHYNSLRVGKGLLWGLGFFWLYRSWPDRNAAFTALCTGMALGVLGVGVWALWEQFQFAGAATTMDYRVTGSFSSMHTGGGHFEAYLVMALPFVWGLAFRSRNWALRGLLALVFVFGAYALLSTVARGGAIALGLALLLLIAGTWRARAATETFAPTGAAATARGSRLWPPLLLGVLTVVVMLVGISGAFWQQRMSQTGTDVDIRVRHWSEVLGLRDGSWMTTLFGQGLGSLPASNLAHKLPTEAGSYRYGQADGKPFLALNSTGTLYMAQRVDVEPGQTLALELEVRAPAGKAGLQASLCEKNLFNSLKCQWLNVDFKPDDKAWQASHQTFSTGQVGAGNWLTRRPVQFSLYNPVAGTVVEVSQVRLTDKADNNLLQNGDFAQGGDFWFFKSGDHLFWHAKNLWVHLLFEQGWLGLALHGVLVLLALATLARPFVRGAMETTVWLAALAGMLVVSVVESLLDAPRLALLTYFVLFSAAAYGSSVRRQGAGPGASRRASANGVRLRPPVEPASEV